MSEQDLQIGNVVAAFGEVFYRLGEFASRPKEDASMQARPKYVADAMRSYVEARADYVHSFGQDGLIKCLDNGISSWIATYPDLHSVPELEQMADLAIVVKYGL